MSVAYSIHVKFTQLQNTQICFSCAVLMFFGVSRHIQFETYKNLYLSLKHPIKIAVLEHSTILDRTNC